MKLLKSIRSGLLGAALAWAAVVGSAKAGNVGDYIYLGNGVYFTATEGSMYDSTSAAVQNGTLVTTRQALATATKKQTDLIADQIASRLDASTQQSTGSYSLLPASGGNAGASHHKGSVWASAGIDNLKEDKISSYGGWKGNLWTLGLGYDYKFNDKVLAGVALFYSNLNGSTAFNKGDMKENAYGFAPYVGFKVHPCFGISIMAGYSRVNKDYSRTTPNTASAAAGLTGPKATSSPRSDRYFAAISADLKHHVNRWNLLARLGYTYMTDKQKSFVEKNGQVNQTTFRTQDRTYGSMSTNLNRLSLRLQAGYKVSNVVEPYAFLTYARDFSATKISVPDALGTLRAGPGTPATVSYTSPNSQRSNNTFGGGLGLNANLGCNWTGGLEAGYAQSKRLKIISGAARVKWVF